MNVQPIETERRKPPRKETVCRADKEAVYRLMACYGESIYVAARRRNIGVLEAAEAILEICREREQAAFRRGALSAMPPHSPRPMGRAA